MTQHLPLWNLGYIPPVVCDLASKNYMAIEPKDATMGNKGDELSHIHRNTTVRFAPIDDWFGHMLRGFGLRANKVCNWGFEINDHEAVQFAHYGPEQHYNWHIDNFPLMGLSTDRKVSVVCLMCDPSEFEAGELQLRFRQDYTAPLVKGSVIAFPSFVEHRVTPVLSGMRSSATMWLNGPRFK